VSPGHIPATLRRLVRTRARNRCEYCLLAEQDAFFPHEPDHIIALKHGGETTGENLALACFDCNRFKGSDIASVDPITGRIVPLFNPRVQAWSDHFVSEAGRINPLTPVAREVRATLAIGGRYP
jgi:5-methylcytosine-specific restriction endonuclease McrA